ncbi:transposable element Tcb1 transposase [Trichonephila clavipes]|nr:transposable element Tcb1 transposase [Trichonephila clavipes]
MVWGVNAYNTWPLLVIIRGTMIAQRYIHNFLQTQVWPLIQEFSGAIFQQGGARPHTARLSQDCFCIATTLPWPARFPELSPMKHIWDGKLGISRVPTN